MFYEELTKTVNPVEISLMDKNNKYFFIFVYSLKAYATTLNIYIISPEFLKQMFVLIQ